MVRPRWWKQWRDERDVLSPRQHRGERPDEIACCEDCLASGGTWVHPARVWRELIEGEKLRPVVDRVYPLAEIADALETMGEGHVQGKLVVRIE
jgi:hypothetical protein